ncbi:synaptosomal-associated protein 29 [Centruroides vittatus]|uniref:synaptosomal-associated protein 29 n=1 Tax=Centruroides vittatus TaxID=120091 RepID=UPI0035104056
MAMSGREIRNPNPFYTEEAEDVDDFEFLSHPKHGKTGYILRGNDDNVNTDWEQRRMQLLDEKRQIEERTLQGTKFSLGLLHESEQVGFATADELMRQREQLRNVEDKVDEINSTMRISQKHLNSMKSIFGGIKSYFSRSNSNATLPTKTLQEEPLAQPCPLQTTVEKIRGDGGFESREHHPALAARGIDYSSTSPDDRLRDPGYDFSERVEQQINTNIDQMSLGLGRLKNLAIGLGDEIEEQNSMLDRITGKVEKSDETVEYQNRQMRRILKK